MTNRFQFVALLLISSSIGIFACTDAGSAASGSTEPAALISGKPGYVSFEHEEGRFPMAENGQPVPLYISGEDYPGVIRAFRDLQADIERVTRIIPEIHNESMPELPRMIIAGTAGKNPVIDRLASEGKLDLSNVEGRWETFQLQVVIDPFPGTDEALVITGSDKRGTIFGIYELSRQIGVSPWFWWADVPVPHQPDLYISPEPYTLGEPAVQYRGIFINNENPSLYGWVNHTYGGFNHNFYEKVFELILRLRGNYLWPAMWGKAFHDDDPMNPELADEYGVVIGYTHHEPMNRAHVEWARYGEGAWNYETNPEVLRNFWAEGIGAMKDYESSVTLGMRGDGDEPMTDEANIELLERIVRDQRVLLKEHAQQDPGDILQIWALYKEVQEYYERGMEVPEDVMILLANDNWGNVRLLPDPETSGEREGGWGMYYHFDYVGGPRNYKWINTIQISRIWEQMHLTYRHGVDRLWLVNVGDIKPMEFPISFFLDYAWNPDAMPLESMDDYPRAWAKQQFGSEFADEIAYLLTEYTRFNSRRKPELLNHETYSLVHFREAERIVDDYNSLTEKAKELYERLPEEYKDAYFQLVLYPVEASANINELYKTVAENRLYASQGRAATNELGGKARSHFDRNDELDHFFHHELSGGKWRHMMDQTRIGYTYWQQPEVNAMPDISEIDIPASSEMGIAIEGSENWWPNSGEDAVLPVFDPFNRESFYIEIFNRGSVPFEFTVETGEPWLKVSSTGGTVEKQERIFVDVDWDEAPAGESRVPVSITGPGNEPVIVQAEVNNPQTTDGSRPSGFIESNGYVAMEAPNYSRNISVGEAGWKNIPQLGRTLSAMTPFPVLAESRNPGSADSPRLEYDMHLFSSGEVTVKVYLSPTKNYSKNYRNPDGIRLGISFNDDEPQIVNIHESMQGGFINNVWYQWVGNNINIIESTYTIESPGNHVLKIWMADSGVVVQRVVVETGDIPVTYLGPPESAFVD